MKLPNSRIVLIACLLMLAWAGKPWAADISIHGAGATFPFPLYAKWTKDYKRLTGVDVVYDPVGSGAGMLQVERHQVDFGATDAPLNDDELQRIGVKQFPAVIGGVVPVINVGGLKSGELRLNGQVLGDIYLGRIKKWNDQAIATLNPAMRLPNVNITVVHRSDPSGTTFLWSDFLSKSNPDWKVQLGTATALAWPTGVAGTGNEGVASHVQRTRNSIGYVEYAYAKQHRLALASVRNHDGVYALPSRTSFEAAANAAHWEKAADLHQILTNLPGADSWPITGASFIVVPVDSAQRHDAAQVIKFFDWALKRGQQAAQDLDYVPLPEAAVCLVEQIWASPSK